MHTNAISQNDSDQFADIDSYTAVMNGLIDQQTQLISSIDDEMNEIASDLNATMPNRLSSESNEKGTAKVMTLAFAHGQQIRPPVIQSNLKNSSHSTDCTLIARPSEVYSRRTGPCGDALRFSGAVRFRCEET